MGAFFDKVFSNELKVPTSGIQVLLQSHTEHLWTGLVRLAFMDDRQLHLLLKKGKLINSYEVTPETWTPLASEELLDKLRSIQEAYTCSVRLSSEGLYICKLLIQNHGKSREVETIRTIQIPNHQAFSNDQNETKLVRLDWKNATGATLFPGNKLIGQSLFYATEKVQDEQGLSPAFHTWKEADCVLTMYLADLSVSVWQEYYLRNLFTHIWERTLDRIEMVAGRAIIDSIIRVTAIYISQQDIEIGFISRRLVDHEIFSSPQQAAETYHQVTDVMMRHIATIIGPRLLSTILREIVLALPQAEEEIANKFAIFPQGYSYD